MVEPEILELVDGIGMLSEQESLARYNAYAERYITQLSIEAKTLIDMVNKLILPAGIKYADMINGKGIRVSLFVSGCTHCCKNCFNEETWSETYGNKFTEKEENEIIDYFKKYGKTRIYS